MARLLDSLPGLVLVLNSHRQVVFANRALCLLLGLESSQDVHGLRPGEMLACDRASIEAAGCGTSSFCRYCGAVGTIMASQEAGVQVVNECRITANQGATHFDLRVSAAPLELDQEVFTVFTVQDIAHEKRRRVLERVFFHDVGNTAMALMTLSEILCEEAEDEVEELATDMRTGVFRLVSELETQRALAAAEADELKVNPSVVCTLNMLNEAAHYAEYATQATSDTVVLDPSAARVHFEVDSDLLNRVVFNMLKNAIEASKPQNKVTMGCRREGGQVILWVHNCTVMSESAQAQMFQRSFSTKGAGRGLGTYSMRLLTERYLGGTIGFTSSHDEGTTFWVSLPSARDMTRLPGSASL